MPWALRKLSIKVARAAPSPEVTRKIVQENNHGGEMLYDVHATITTDEMILA